MLKKYQEFLQRKKGEYDILKNQYTKYLSQLEVLKKEEQDLLYIQELAQNIAKLTQEKIKIHITEIVNTAIQYIPFNDSEIIFDMDFEIKRNNTECIFYFRKKGNKINPINSSGGGLLDIVSFALLLSVWSLKNNPKNNTIILDEPFKWLSVDLIPYAATLLKEVSKKLGLQIIMITHDPEFIEIADKNFKLVKNSDNLKII